MWYKHVAGRFFGLVTKHACDRQTDGRTEYDFQDRASIAASRGKKREMSRTAFHSKDSQKQVWHRRGAFLGLFVEKSQLSSFFYCY